MRLDSHVHFWRYTAAEYAWIDASMARFSGTSCPETRGPDATGRHRRVRRRPGAADARGNALDAGSSPTIIHSLPVSLAGSICESSDLDAQIESVEHPKLVGVRHIVQAEADDFLLDDDFRRGVARLGRHGLAYDILIYARQIPAAIDFAAALPEGRLVLDHLGKPDIRADGFDGVAS